MGDENIKKVKEREKRRGKEKRERRRGKKKRERRKIIPFPSD